MLRRLLKDFRWSVIPVPGRVIAVIFFMFLFIIPLTTDSRFIMLVFTIASIYAIFAMSFL